MPNRILRDWTDSDAVNSLDAHAERFFARLIMKVDDFGRFHATPKLLRSSLFPQTFDSIRDTDISRWLAACESAELIAVYEVQGKTYLEITKFGQRLRSAKSKFPEPPPNDSKPPTSARSSPPDASIPPPYSESETESNSESSPPTPQRGFGDDGGILTSDSEQRIVADRLRELGIRTYIPVASKSLQLRPFAVVMQTIDHFAEKLRLPDGTLAYDQGPQYLAWRIASEDCGEQDPAAGWMEPDNDEFLKRRRIAHEATKRTETRAEADRRAEVAAQPSPREAQYGATVDAMTWDDAEAAIVDSPNADFLRRKIVRERGNLDRPGLSPMLRTELLRIVEAKNGAAAELETQRG